MSFKNLFNPITLGKVTLRNRIVMPAMTTVFANAYGAVTERLMNYHAERAKGGVGLIITETLCVDYPIGKGGHATILRIDYDKFIPGLSELVKAVHVHGGKIASQLHHAGRQTTLDFTEGHQPVCASAVYDPVSGVQPRALTIDEIGDIMKKFADGARRAKAAGFDAIEIHGAHGYLIQQFLSPHTNRRLDKYGGNLDRRMTFALEVLTCIREKVGYDFPVIYRLSAEEHIPGGLTCDDTKVIARKLEQEGVDALHISSGMNETPTEFSDTPPAAVPRGCYVPYAEAIKKVVNVPVITVGRITDPLLAENILAEGKADLIAMGRALIADPELPRKAREGRLDDIRTCIACRGCSLRINSGLPLGCDINAAAGEEKTSRLEPVKKPKKILIVGGGPGGMEAARVLALRGHEAILYDDKSELGGQLLMATKPPHKEELTNLLVYLSTQIKKLNVDVNLGKPVTASLVQEINPNVVILATGAHSLVPNIPGITSENVVTAWDVLMGKVEVGEEIVVAGGGDVGCETAEFLANKEKSLSLIEMLDEVAYDVEYRTRDLMLKRLAANNVRILTGCVIIGITEKGVSVVDKRRNRIKTIHAENVVLALGARPNTTLTNELKGTIPALYSIGDCVKPRKVPDAIREAFKLARKV